MLGDGSRARAFRLLDEMGLLVHVLPEVAACRGVLQPTDYHPEGDVLVHSMLALEKLPPDASDDAAWATLLHDIGKPGTFSQETGRIRFIGHSELGAEMAEVIAERLRFSKASRERVAWLVRRHLHPRDAPQMRRSTLRRLLAEPWLADLLVVAHADALAGSGDVSHLEFIEQARAEIGDALPPPFITGADLRDAGLPAGRAFGRILERIRTEQLEGTLATREEALARAAELVAAEPLDGTP